MKAPKKLLIVGAAVLTLAAIASPVIASQPPLYELKRSEDFPFNVGFTVGDCLVSTTEYSTKHFVLGRPVASTNVGKATLLDAEGKTCTGITIPLPTPLPPIFVPPSAEVPFAVADVRNPGSGTVIASYAILSPDAFAWPYPPYFLYGGANAWLTKGGTSPTLTYEGYVFAYIGGVPQQEDYLKVEFMAQGNPDEGFDVYPVLP